MNKWTELRTAYQVAKLGTVSAAAEVLGLHRATVNRHIDTLESHLQAKIFIRHRHGYALTETGQEVLRVAQKAEELIEDLAGRLQGGNTQVEGEIKLTILAPFAQLLMGAVAMFRRKHPQCRVDVNVYEGLARLEYGEAHIALRAGAKPDHPDYIVSKFHSFGFNLYAHESYLARHGKPRDVGELSGHLFVLNEAENVRELIGLWLDKHVRPEMVALSTQDMVAVEEAICSGIGIGFLGDQEASMRSGVTAIFPPNPDWTIPCWIVTHVDLHHTEKVKAMLECIKSLDTLR